MKFLIGEILICLIGASILGVIVGWLLKTVFTGRKVSRLNNEWDAKFQALETSSNTAIAEITEKNDVLHKDINQQRSKMASLESTMQVKEKSLLALQAESKSLTSKLTDKQETLDAARDETERLASQQNDQRQRLESMVAAKENEINQLKKNIENAQSITPRSQPQIKTATKPAYRDPLREGKSASTTDSSYSKEHDERIKALNEQRQKLIDERKQLEEREKHFASKLAYGDDTRAYLDETEHVDLSSAREELDKTQSLNSSDIDNDPDSKTLWDKVKSSVNKPKP